ncbi:MAG: ABC transporter ATP-binding protein [Pseudohongiellaceae bacterium]|nr:ABC transporter ATP-binding protein [Pseudohongiellaceae bacterium]
MSKEKALDPTPLRVEKLSKSFGDTPVLKELNLTVETGAVHGLVGLNGSGKTTTMECLLGMQPYHAGKISIMGLKPEQLYKHAGKVVSVFDSPSLHPQLTVKQTLEHACLLCERPARTPTQVEAMLGISQYSQYKIKHLSLGNRRRTSIAQALLGRPEFIILDEPFNGLDAGGVDDLLNLISRLNREEGTSFLLSSHQLPYLEKICSHISVLHRGRIAVSGHVSRLFNAQHSRLLVHCDDVVRACAIVQGMPGVEIEDNSYPGLLTLQLDGVNPALINQKLVEKGIAIHELVREKPSLETLFQAVVATDPLPALEVEI